MFEEAGDEVEKAVAVEVSGIDEGLEIGHAADVDADFHAFVEGG